MNIGRVDGCIDWRHDFSLLISSLRGSLVIHGDKSAVNQGISSAVESSWIVKDSRTGQEDFRKAKATAFPYVVSKNVEIMSKRDMHGLTVKFWSRKHAR